MYHLLLYALKTVLLGIDTIKTVYVFGSIVKPWFQLDSDIDFAILFRQDIQHNVKISSICQIKEKMSHLIRRFIDISEVFSNEKNYLKEKLGTYKEAYTNE